MARPLTPVLGYLRNLRPGPRPADCDDGQLLSLFAGRNDQEAFAEVVRRHGPMVHGVCRRVLGGAPDADDAFQATFLVLASRAGSLRRPELLGPWLFAVARRTAWRARATRDRRRAREAPLEDRPAPAGPDLLELRDLRPLLDEAIAGLPTRYRDPVVLCYLEGLTNAEAARRLGCPPGTIATRLSRARDRLRGRLTRRGVALSGTALAVALAENVFAGVSPTLTDATARAAAAYAAGHGAAAGAVTAQVAALTKGVGKAMLLERMRMVVAGAVLLLAAAGTGTLVMQAEAGETPAPPPAVVQPAEPRRAAPPAALPAPIKFRDGNFVVHAPSVEVATIVATLAEAYRKDLALAWLGKELPDWMEPCEIHVKVTMGAPAGATSFNFDRGKVLSRRMELHGPLEKMLAGSLPHEIAHTVLADHFGAPLPRWADEGAAVLAEPPAEQERHEKMARSLMLEPGKALPVVGTLGQPIPLRRLFPMTSYPPNVMALHAQGYSVTKFLTGRKDRKTFLAFVGQGMKGDWDAAAREHYGFKTVEALEDAWLAALRPRDPRTAAAPITPPEAPAQAHSTQPPLTALARLIPDGKLRLSYPVLVWEPTTWYVPGGAGKGTSVPVTSYSAVSRLAEQEVELSSVRFMSVDREAVLPRAALAALRKQGADRKEGATVLVAGDSLPVNPFHLRLIRPEALLLIVPGGPPPAPGRRVEPSPPLPPPPPLPAVPTEPAPAVPAPRR